MGCRLTDGVSRDYLKEWTMTNQPDLIPIFYDGWHTYQNELIKAIAPLTDEQLLLRAGTGMRTAGQIATHIVSVRAGWFFYDLKEGGETFEEIDGWQFDEERQRTAAELVQGLETTWTMMHAIMAGWTPEQWAETWPNESEFAPPVHSRPWIIWHLIEHDLHHGGELSITLGALGLKGLEI
jgi:uncharacterized damage-inducible protein DinB